MLNTTLCYLERGDAYLMLHRIKKKDDLNRDKWIGIGGKCEEGESPDECLRREVREETGLTLTELQFRGVVTFLSHDSGSDQFMYLFTATGWTGELNMDCSEGELAWVPKEKVCDLPIWEGDEIFFRSWRGGGGESPAGRIRHPADQTLKAPGELQLRHHLLLLRAPDAAGAGWGRFPDPGGRGQLYGGGEGAGGVRPHPPGAQIGYMLPKFQQKYGDKVLAIDMVDFASRNVEHVINVVAQEAHAAA